jgi:hypothetical protein
MVKVLNLMLHIFNLVRIWEDTGVNFAMKKALALSAFALILTLPLVSSAGTMTSTFLTSTSGTSDLGIGDTIQLEVAFQSTLNFSYTTFVFSLGGDATAARAGGPSAGPVWAGVQGTVDNWEWNYKAGGNNTVKFATNGVILPAAQQPGIGTPVLIGNGFFGQSGLTGNGANSTLGTVTITASAAGSFEGGAFEIVGLDTMEGTSGAEPFISNTFGYSVIPEPGTAILMVLGLGGLGVMGRKSRK